MSIKPDTWIKKMADKKKMIEPFSDGRKVKGSISYGVSSYGYDMRLSDEFRIFRGKQEIVDPKAPFLNSFDDFKGSVCIIPPNSFVLARSLEYFRIPRNILTICSGKSTYARSGIIVNVTPFEPEWEGHATIAISNTSPVPAKIYAFEGIAQLIFFESDEKCAVSYADKKGKYQATKKITHSKI